MYIVMLSFQQAFGLIVNKLFSVEEQLLTVNAASL